MDRVCAYNPRNVHSLIGHLVGNCAGSPRVFSLCVTVRVYRVFKRVQPSIHDVITTFGFSSSPRKPITRDAFFLFNRICTSRRGGKYFLSHYAQRIIFPVVRGALYRSYCGVIYYIRRAHVNIIGRDGGGPRESYVSGTCRRRARCARERKGAVYVGAMSTSRLFSYTRTHTRRRRRCTARARTHTHTHRCSPVQVSRMYCTATAEAVVKGRRARRQRHILYIMYVFDI